MTTGQLDFLDLITLASFVIALQNLEENITQSDKAELQEENVMVDLDIINGTIAEWEAKDLTFLVVERLAWLYIVRDNAVMRLKEGQRFGVYRYACDRVIVGQ